MKVELEVSGFGLVHRLPGQPAPALPWPAAGGSVSPGFSGKKRLRGRLRRSRSQPAACLSQFPLHRRVTGPETEILLVLHDGIRVVFIAPVEARQTEAQLRSLGRVHDLVVQSGDGVL